VDDDQRRWFSAWVRGVRDSADRDYISARATSRLGLHQSSAWSALQAVEKYFKAILLFNGRSVKRKRSHDLIKLHQAVRSLPRLGFRLPDDTGEFLGYLTDQGRNRYTDFAVIVQGSELLQLDRLVWHTRRFCQDFRLMPDDESRFPGEAERRLALIPEDRVSAVVGDFSIPAGHLEELLAGPPTPLREALVWRNFFYGVRPKHRINYSRRISVQRPLHLLQPERLLPVLRPLVFFPPDIEGFFQEMLEERSVDETI